MVEEVEVQQNTTKKNKTEEPKEEKKEEEPPKKKEEPPAVEVPAIPLGPIAADTVKPSEVSTPDMIISKPTPKRSIQPAIDMLPVSDPGESKYSTPPKEQ